MWLWNPDNRTLHATVRANKRLTKRSLLYFDPEPRLPSSLATHQVRTVGKAALKMQDTFSL
jgi:hypothetical protein